MASVREHTVSFRYAHLRKTEKSAKFRVHPPCGVLKTSALQAITIARDCFNNGH